ncbi:hypothetical protein DTO169E5_8685 [Paecilomyces variotii]|nr:hypothetical protein DTO169E5_8685 [Paecilomyces variotii]
MRRRYFLLRSAIYHVSRDIASPMSCSALPIRAIKVDISSYRIDIQDRRFKRSNAEMLERTFERQKVDLEFTLRRVFGKTSFRPLQREVILAAVEGHDIFLQAATSFGKSLCFQLPAVINHGVTVVVSPLLALMMDQVSALQTLGVAVSTINSTTPLSERRNIVDDLLSGHPIIRLLYVTPELCLTETFRRTLKTMHAQGELKRIAIDEAHCISEWGHDFRPAYKELAWFRRALVNPPVPISALTATATPRVRTDIINLLGLDPATLRTFNTPSARPNIHYEVRYFADSENDEICTATSQLDDLLAWLNSIQRRREARMSTDAGDDTAKPKTPGKKLKPMSGIVYAPYRSICESLAKALSSSGNRIHAVAYHAGLQAAERSRIQAMWTSNGPVDAADDDDTAFSIIVATNAFGMGIDNPHVRFVVHWNTPRSFEGFVQESGRAGRDGRAAMSLVYYGILQRDRAYELMKRDFRNAISNKTKDGLTSTKVKSHQARIDSFKKVVRYCETTTRCRHEIIKEYSGDLDLEMMGSQVPREYNSTQAGQNGSFPASPCDFACDFCKEGAQSVTRRKQKMLTDMEDFEHTGALPQQLFEMMFPELC